MVNSSLISTFRKQHAKINAISDFFCFFVFIAISHVITGMGKNLYENYKAVEVLLQSFRTTFPVASNGFSYFVTSGNYEKSKYNFFLLTNTGKLK